MTKAATPRRTGRKAAAPTAATTSVAPDAAGDHWFVIPGITWEGYVAINVAVSEPPNPRRIYCDGRLTLSTESRTHGLRSRCLFVLVSALAAGLRITRELGGRATFRRPRKRGGVEGDETFYLGPHAEIMKGSKDIDLDIQPPPDLAVEVGVSRSADDAVVVWGRVGVPEAWRFDPIGRKCTFLGRRRNGTYAEVARSIAFPMLPAEDVVEQMKLADGIGIAGWQVRVRRWVRRVIFPRNRGGQR